MKVTLTPLTRASRRALVLASLTALAVAQEPAIDAAEAPDEAAPAAEEVSEFGAPLIVNGRRISDRAIKRFLIYGIGQVVLETDRLAVLIEHELDVRAGEIERRILAERHEGKELGDLSEQERAALEADIKKEIEGYRLDPAYYEWVRDGEITSFKRRYPTLNMDAEISRAYGSTDWYDLQLRRTLEFDACFFPGDPAEWPDITKESIYAGSPDVDLVQDMKESWDRRLAEAQEAGEPYPVREDEMFFGLLRDYVIGTLNSTVTMQTSVRGLDDKFVMVMEGDGWKAEFETDELYERVRPVVTDREVQLAKQFLALMAATEDRLREDGNLISLEEHYEKLADTELELEGTMFNMQFLALTGHQFPSIQAFEEHMRLVESFRNTLLPQLMEPPGGGVPPALQEYVSLANRTLGIARADAEVMLISAFDFMNYRWKEGGWEEARIEAESLMDEINDYRDRLARAEEERRLAVEEGRNYEPDEELLSFEQYWGQMLDLHSDYWDAPMPEEGKMPPMNSLYQKGRFGSQTRNDLDRSIGESSYFKLLSGDSIADTIFYDMSPGDVAGPIKGPQGYYIVYLRGRTPPQNPLNLRQERHLHLLKEEFVRNRFIDFAHESLAQAEVSGLDPL